MLAWFPMLIAEFKNRSFFKSVFSNLVDFFRNLFILFKNGSQVKKNLRRVSLSYLMHSLNSVSKNKKNPLWKKFLIFLKKSFFYISKVYSKKSYYIFLYFKKWMKNFLYFYILRETETIKLFINLTKLLWTL